MDSGYFGVLKDIANIEVARCSSRSKRNGKHVVTAVPHPQGLMQVTVYTPESIKNHADNGGVFEVNLS